MAVDQEYLVTEQYKDASNLDARAALHRRFSINTYGWQQWVFDQFRLPPGARVLELGCGPGWLWAENLGRVPAGWDVTLGDLSPGMIAEAQQNLAAGTGRFTFRVIDAQSLPFEDGWFDGVIANHMLYHVPDRERAVGEIWRVLRPGGRFYAALNGGDHLKEIHELEHRFGYTHEEFWPGFSDMFKLDDGVALIGGIFGGQVTVHDYEGGLVVTEAEPLIAYLLSGKAKSFLTGERLAALRAALEAEIGAKGAIHITKETGLIEAVKQDTGVGL